MANLIKPELFTSILGAKFTGAVKVLPLAVDLGEIEGFREVGETIHFPRFEALSGLVTDMKTKAEMDTEKLSQKDSTAIIEHIGRAVAVEDYEDLTALGNHIDEAGRQLGVVFARHLDSRLIAEAKKTLLISTPASANKIRETELNDALGLFGDEQDSEDFAGIIINSKLLGAFYEMQGFVDKNKTFVTDGSGIIRNGLVGYFRNIPVIVSDKDTYDTSTKKCETLIIKKGSLGYKMKKEFNTEIQRNAKAKSSDICADAIFAVKLLNEEGIVLIK
ncbi:hypothetical protein [Clostridium algidicarnis]|uniref:hypothetical protein n=1 Tax=Clostridium algidicarnis TaxID=37659 RepID=UPI000495EED5|nr:hypothetical protein [Clostridium algidicarnis]